MDSVGERYRLLYESIICDLTLSLPSEFKRVEIYIDIQNNEPLFSRQSVGIIDLLAAIRKSTLKPEALSIPSSYNTRSSSTTR